MNKLKRYDAFLEAIFGFGKKTVPYYYSHRFRELLRVLAENRDEVAQQLLYAEDSNQVSDDITLIDITEKEDMISFIQLNRLERFRETDTEKRKDLIDYVRYIWHYTSNSLEHKGWEEQRTEISIGRFVNRVFQKAKITQEHSKIEQFVNAYKVRIKVINDVESLFEFVSGEDIRKWYLEDNYQSNRGQLSNSCMRYKKCQSYFDIYVKNPEVCRLLILKGGDEGKITGRALIWKLKDGKTYMDRQYCNNDSDIKFYQEFAKKQGWSYYGQPMIGDLEVQLSKQSYEEYPYMDTFVCYNYLEHKLSNDEDKWSNKGWYKIVNTNGTFISDDVVYSEYNGEYISRSQSVYCEDISDYVRQDQSVYVESRGLYYSNDSDSIAWSEYDEEYYHIDDAVYSEYLETYLDSEKSVYCYVNKFDEIVIPTEMEDQLVKVVTIDGEERKCFIDAIMINPFTNEWCFKKDSIKIYYCEEIESYITEDESEERGLKIEKNKYLRISQSKYLAEKLGEVNPEILLNYLIELKPSKEILEKIGSYFSKSRYFYLKDESTYTNLEKFYIIKAAIWFSYEEENKNSYFKVYNRDRSNPKFLQMNEKTLLKFFNTDIYARLYTQDYWRTFLEMVDYFLYDIIKDPVMLNQYYILKFK